MNLVDSSFALRALGTLAFLVAVGRPARAQAPPPGEGIDFGGSWSASGQRQTLAMGEGRTASIVRLAGSLVLTSPGKLGRGFGTDSIGFDDGRGNTVGTGVWTDERGDNVFNEIRGGSIETGRTFTGVITGGTGRSGSWIFHRVSTWANTGVAKLSRTTALKISVIRVRIGDTSPGCERILTLRAGG